MVYTGTPSKACERCRKRRNRCDLGRPNCQKCIKAGVDCPGYRNAQDVTFKNVTKQIIRRYDASNPVPRMEDNTRRPVAPSIPVTRALHDQEGVLAVSMAFLLECYLRGSSFEWVRGLYEEVDSSSLFARVVEATALAAYSHECHRMRLLARSRTAYDVSLVQLREAMATSGPISNETLASILLMSRFETLLADGTEAMVMDSWTGHIAGAFSVLESRTEEDNFAGSLSLQLAEQTLNNYNMWCMKMRKIRPDSHIRATEALYQRLDSQMLNSGLRRLRLRSHRLSEAFVKSCRMFENADMSSLRAVISSVASIDADAQAFRELLAAESGYEVRPVQELQDHQNKLEIEPHSGKYHLYQNQHAARVWNNVRMMVITVSYHLFEMAERIQKRENAHHNDIFQQELKDIIAYRGEVITTMCDEICDSAPQFLCPGTVECTHAAASYLSWPLYVAARFLQGDRNRFPKDTLRWIGVEFNMKSAIQAVENLHGPIQHDDWLLACYMF